MWCSCVATGGCWCKPPGSLQPDLFSVLLAQAKINNITSTASAAVSSTPTKEGSSQPVDPCVHLDLDSPAGVAAVVSLVRELRCRPARYRKEHHSEEVSMHIIHCRAGVDSGQPSIGTLYQLTNSPCVSKEHNTAPVVCRPVNLFYAGFAFGSVALSTVVCIENPPPWRCYTRWVRLGRHYSDTARRT